MNKNFFNIIIVGLNLLVATLLVYIGTLTSFILIYIFVFIFIMLFTTFSSSTILQKIIKIIVFAIVLVSQILLNVYIVDKFLDIRIIIYFARLFAVILIYIPFIIERKLFYHYRKSFFESSEKDQEFLPYSFFLYDTDNLFESLKTVAKAGKVFSKINIKEIKANFSRHSSFNYVNKNGLTDDYFKKANEYLDNGVIYIMITRSKTVPSEIIGLFTNKPYNHVSIAFDDNFYTAVSYNGGQNITQPGLNSEQIESLLKNKDSSLIVYTLKATREQKQIIIDKLKEINESGSAYNLLGLVTKKSFKPNIMFCSQFVYTMLQLANLNYFDKKPINVLPTDFVELDYYRKLKFYKEVKFCDKTEEYCVEKSIKKSKQLELWDR